MDFIVIYQVVKQIQTCLKELSALLNNTHLDIILY